MRENQDATIGPLRNNVGNVIGLDHVQLAIPMGQESVARAFYFRATRKAHPALLVRNLPALAERCRAAGFPPVSDEPLEGFERVYVFDPFGNRIELMERC